MKKTLIILTALSLSWTAAAQAGSTRTTPTDSTRFTVASSAYKEG